MAGRTAATLLVLLAALAAPSSALGQGRTLGSPLSQDPNTFGCEVEPTFTGGANTASGSYDFVASGDADCTWFQTGVPGSVDYSDPRTGSVPADGIVTNIAVRSGPNPALMSFVIVRQLAQPGTGTACCWLVQQTPLVQPPANGVTNFAVNLPVQRNVDTRTGIATADYVGVSAVSGTGMLPMVGNGLHNTLAHSSIPGNPQAGFWYPRLGAFQGDVFDGGGGRREAGIPGMELLLQWTWCPRGQNCGPPPPGQQQMPQPAPGNTPGAGQGTGSGSGTGSGPAVASAGADSLAGTEGADRICGLAGDDSVNALAGADTLFGDACDDKAKEVSAAGTSDGSDTLNGGEGDDTIYGAGGRDTVKGEGGNDRIFGGDGNDRLDGGAGNDRLTGGKGTNSYAGGAGKDTISARNRKRETVNCGSGKDSATVDRNDKVRACEKVKRR